MRKEQTYDEKIFPLMKQIIAICKESKIAMVCTFDIRDEDDPDLLCTSCLTTDNYDPPALFRQMVAMLYREGLS